MNRSFFIAAFLLGASAVIWMASTFVGSNNLALAVTLVIACVYAIGFMELVQFRAATSTLTKGLAELPEEQRSAVVLHLWDELSFAEIGEICEVSSNTAASRYRYGIDKMRRRLRPLYEEIQQ